MKFRDDKWLWAWHCGIWQKETSSESETSAYAVPCAVSFQLFHQETFSMAHISFPLDMVKMLITDEKRDIANADFSLFFIFFSQPEGPSLHSLNPSSLTLHFWGGFSQAPCPRGYWWSRRCPWRSRSSRSSLFQPAKGEPHPQLTSSPSPCLPSSPFVGPEVFSLTLFFHFLFLFCLYESKNCQLFFHLKNQTCRQWQVPSFAYQWLKFSAASSPLKLISSSMSSKMHLLTLLVVISVIKRL